MRNMLAPPLKGVVLQTFGAGNAASDSEELMGALREASQGGVIMINNNTQ